MASDFYTNTYNPDVLTCLANLSSDEVFTPPAVVNQMLDLLPQSLWSDSTATFLDPACKSCVFLREIAKRLLEGLKDQIPDLQTRIDHIFHKQLFGIAISELTSLLSRRSLYCSKYPNSRYSITPFTEPAGNIKFHRIEHTWSNGRCVFCGATSIKYQRGLDLETYAYEFIHIFEPEELFEMKFDVIIGNPPYHLNVGVEKENYAVPIFQNFVEQAKKLKPKFLIMITPSRWFTGGRGLNSFRQEMLSDARLKTIVDFPNSQECFPGVDISGGVSYFFWSREYFGPCEFVSINNGIKKISMRKLDEFPILLRYNEALSIIHKVLAKKEKTLDTIVSQQTPFGLISTYRGKSHPFEKSLRLISSSEISHVSLLEIKRNIDWIPLYKVIFSKATSEHAGVADKSGMFKVFSTIRVLSPNEVCTQSYLVGGVFPTIDMCESYSSYLKTKFVRFLLLQALTSQDLSRDKFLFVPIQKFTKPWTDEELYAKYGMTEEEISFIESMIRPMDLNAGQDDAE